LKNLSVGGSSSATPAAKEEPKKEAPKKKEEPKKQAPVEEEEEAGFDDLFG
jgi:ribosomal protein L12E/L44/L45/RPP1/RPP2